MLKISELISKLRAYDQSLQVVCIVNRGKEAQVIDPDTLVLCRLKDGAPYLEITINTIICE